MKTKSIHTFHIPVMGLAFTIDSPIRVGHLGINSVLSVMDDELIERMNALYSQKFQLPYEAITRKTEDFRAKRITAYLDTLDHVVKRKFKALKSELLENKKQLEAYLEQLPDTAELKVELQRYIAHNKGAAYLKTLLDQYLKPGRIDVNIMTKVDRTPFQNQVALEDHYSDAHAALRGFANSTVESAVVLSAGMNAKLFSYFQTFDVFYPKPEQEFAKKIILKVSDYRSALIQGSFLAKKGLWVSEYRIESGLNCGGHAFATEGLLLGPIMEEFKTKRFELQSKIHELLCQALKASDRFVPLEPLDMQVTVQGGVGTADEHQFLLDYYQVDSVGWGSPFLLVPEATSVDRDTRSLLMKATEKDLYLSGMSPLGIPFHTIKGTTHDALKESRIRANKAGSSCPRKYLALDTSTDKEGICTASRKFQTKQLQALEDVRETLMGPEYEDRKNEITEKSCLCIGLANASFLEHKLPVKGEKQGVIICPGPNIAYFDKEVSLSKMIRHIYGYDSVLEAPHSRPNFLIKELQLYLEQYDRERITTDQLGTPMAYKKLEKFKLNLIAGIEYYDALLNHESTFFSSECSAIRESLEQARRYLKG